MRKITTLVRISFGVLFIIFGLNGFFNFLPMPAPTPEGGAFLGALAKTGFIFPIIKGIEALVGVAMIINRFTSLALVVLAPILTVIVLYNVVLDSHGLPITTLLTGMYSYLVYKHWENYQQLVAPKAI